MKIDYKKLSIEFDLLLKKVTKEDFEKWYIMDNLRSKKINKMEKRDIPWEIQFFAMRNIVSRPEEHASGKACDAWIRKKRKKFANEVMDLFESINKPTDIKI